MKTFVKEEKAILDTIKLIPGIDGSTLYDDIAKKFNRTVSQMRGVTCRLLDAGHIYHAAVTEGGHMIYKYFPDATTRNRAYPDPKFHHKKVKREKSAQQELPVTQPQPAPTMSEGAAIIKDVRVRNAMLDAQEKDTQPRPRVERNPLVLPVVQPMQFTMGDRTVYAIQPRHLYELFTRLAAIFNPGL